jgi:glutathione synthase/RimK-type ligase-like ATP-grasp enzyme
MRALREPLSTWPSHDWPVVSVLTTRPFHPAMRALIDACAEHAIDLRCGRSIDPQAVLVMQWSHHQASIRSTARSFCDHHGIELINPRAIDKWSQAVRFSQAGLPIPRTRRVRSLDEALSVADTIGYPVVVKPLFGLRSSGVELMRDRTDLALRWRPSQALLQEYLPEGFRCARLLVVNDQVVHRIRRVARDGFHATYDHGRRATLEPFGRLDCDALAIAACRVLGVTIGGVDLVETANGPRLLEVNHFCVDFADRELHGLDAVAQVARVLFAKSQGRLGRHDVGGAEPRTPRIRIVTGLRQDPAISIIRAACEREGLNVEVSARTDPTADGLWFWGLTAGHHRRASSRARAIALPSINGRSYTLWTQRGILFRAGLRVPRSRYANTLERALHFAQDIGYPVLLRLNVDPSQRLPFYAGCAQELSAAWPGNGTVIIEQAGRGAGPALRVWVAGSFISCSTPVPDEWRECALAACRTLEVDMGVVEIAAMDRQPVILRVLQRGTWTKRLPPHQLEAAMLDLARTLRHRVQQGSPAVRAGRVAARKLCVLLARSYQGPGYRTGNIHAVYHQLLQQGHRVLCLDGRFDAALVAQADLVLQDPTHAFGFSPRGDALDAQLFQHAAERCHLLRHLRSGTSDKRAMGELAMRLQVRAPRLLNVDSVCESDLPIVVKPRRGSLGIGVRLVRTLAELKQLARPQAILQQFIDSGTGYAVSIRVITVVHTVVAAGLFFNRATVCSNLSRGGRAIALTGPGQGMLLTREESELLERVGIDPHRRQLPPAVSEMATRIGRHHARHGAQMIGQDFIVDPAGRWYFLEVNMGFGTAVFNVTDGEGYANNGRGMRHAGRILATELVRHFSR